MNHKLWLCFNVKEALPNHKQPLWRMFTQVHANAISEHILTL